jgi:hypothetical protein
MARDEGLEELLSQNLAEMPELTQKASSRCETERELQLAP